jgi:hypothetical protein
MDESTCASNVVGMLIKFIPRLIMLAAKAPRSPIIPPPKDIKISFLLKLLRRHFSTSSFTLLNDLNFSLAEYSNTWRSYFLRIFFNLVLNLFGILLSTTKAIFLHPDREF